MRVRLRFVGSGRWAALVIEVVSWTSAAKRHAINQDFPSRTLCGWWIPKGAVKDEGVDAFPTCLRCELSVMRS